jgi:signal transduction histidine kinase
MKKSLFTKLMTTYFIIIVISFSLVAVSLSGWFYNYYYEERKNALIREGVNLNAVVSDFIHKRASKDDLVFQISIIDRLLNARVWVVDNYGYLVAFSGNEMGNMSGQQLSYQEFEEVRRGNIIVKTGTFKERFTSPMLTVGIPIFVNDQVQFVVFLHSPLEEIRNALEKVYFVIWMAAFFAMVISTFIIYYVSDRILIRPLEKINQTAKLISKGELDKRVSLVSNDEIGDLAVSFNYMADTLKNLENMRKSFIANVSHELRSPMTSINGFITGMIDGTIPQEKWNYYLNIVHDEIKRLGRLINDLLDLARLESMEFSLNMDSFDINELIGSRVVKFEERINEKSIDMDVVLIKSKLKVKGDRDRIDQVLTNLIDNSIKFVPEGGKIQIKTQVKETRLLVSVYNNGPGIPKDEIKYIWERFHKVDKARSKGGGTGLGLSIARQIINQHNQTIWVESGDLGTTFIFTLSIE